MLSLTCKTAIKAVIYLSSKSINGERIGFKEIARHTNASEHTVGKVLQTLAREKIISSQKGPTGGFYLTNQQLMQSISIIVETIDGKDAFKECGLGLRKCSESHPCPIHFEYKVARDLIEKLFHEKKIIDLTDKVSGGIAYLIG